ncbi:hypothetical protein [Meiothermus rufus]|uniref:hypothetical protein n=1 Tax=Meiothermus rufus TaxID=604332 RepID=UPI000405BB47|nr:hypothetical protein [Meiothermus rufus]
MLQFIPGYPLFRFFRGLEGSFVGGLGKEAAQPATEHADELLEARVFQQARGAGLRDFGLEVPGLR